jgi:hypothetical protein
MFASAATCTSLAFCRQPSISFLAKAKTVFHFNPIMKLRPKMLLVFAAIVAPGMGVLYFLSHDLPLSSFRHLETGQMLEGHIRVTTIVRRLKEFSHVDRTDEKAPGDLNQVFLNLLVNAAHGIEDVVKSTAAKGKIIVRFNQDGGFAEISISDTDPGISEDLRDKIFDPFFTTKTVRTGTGQGLALARAIVVEKHGGTLTFESQSGDGTTFLIRLPLSGATMREEALAK